jgi:hypothetical protein
MVIWSNGYDTSGKCNELRNQSAVLEEVVIRVEILPAFGSGGGLYLVGVWETTF